MLKSIVLSRNAFENIIGHLAEIESNRDRIIQTYFPEHNREREEFEELLNRYTEQLDSVIRNIYVSESKTCKKTQDTFTDSINNFPFVIIGSQVEILDLDNQKSYKYRIVDPIHPCERVNDVAYISPVGQAFLLKEVNDEIEVDTSVIRLSYRIKSIKLAE